MTRRALEYLGLAAIVAALAASIALYRASGVEWRLELGAAAESGGPQPPDPLALLSDDLGVVRSELTALRAEQGVLRTELAAALDTLANAIAAPRVEPHVEPRVEPHVEPHVEPRVEPAAAPTDADLAPAIAQPVAHSSAAPEPSPIAAAGGAAAPAKRGFLSFQVATSGLDFERTLRFGILPQLSQVGFDARSTLHDFSGTSSAVRGELVARLGDPAQACRGRIEVDAGTLDTRNADRDVALREHLDESRHPRIEYELESLRAPLVDAGARTIGGTACGMLRVRGVARRLEMPVRVSIDASQRLVIEGEAKLHLPDYEVPVPSKLGLISMEPDVRIWIALRARSLGPADAQEPSRER